MYATPDELRNRIKRFYSELYYDDTLSAADDSLAAQDIASAEAEIDSSVSTRYALPVSAPESLSILKTWTLILAEELAWSRSASGSIPENVKDRAANIRKILTKIVDADAVLPGAVESRSAAASSDVFISPPQCSREQLKGW